MYISSLVHAAPYYELPMPITKLRALLQFRLGSHALPIEQGRFSKPQVPRNLRRGSLCSTRSVGDERHYLFECPKFDDIRAQFAELYMRARQVPCALSCGRRTNRVCVIA